MKHVNIAAFDCPDAWFKTLKNIWNEGDAFQVGYGSEETETKKLNLTIEIMHPENRPLRQRQGSLRHGLRAVVRVDLPVVRQRGKAR